METELMEKTKVKYSKSKIISTSFVVISSILGISTFLAAITIPIFPIAHTRGDAPKPATNFNECIEAGNPVLGTYPRQCEDRGRIFTDVVPEEDQIYFLMDF